MVEQPHRASGLRSGSAVISVVGEGLILIPAACVGLSNKPGAVDTGVTQPGVDAEKTLAADRVATRNGVRRACAGQRDRGRCAGRWRQGRGAGRTGLSGGGGGRRRGRQAGGQAGHAGQAYRRCDGDQANSFHGLPLVLVAPRARLSLARGHLGEALRSLLAPRYRGSSTAGQTPKAAAVPGFPQPNRGVSGP
jgi:hypothetical protein